MGLLVPCSIGIYDPSDRFLGVAAIDLSVGFVVDHVLRLDEFPPGTEVFLVDPSGKILLRSGLRDAARTAQRFETVPFPYPQLVERLKRGEVSGAFAVSGRQVAFSHLESLNWSYVVLGDEHALVP
jgi:hypothetical protein